jgi:hypothetical protein
MKIVIPGLFLLFSCTDISAQIGGTVFRDFNGNGQQDNTTAAGTNAANIEPGIAGIIIKAFNSSDVLIASQTTNSNGFYSFPVGSGANQVSNGTAVRLEYVLPQNCIANSVTEFTGQSGSVYGSNIQFKVQSSSVVTANFSLSNPEQYRGSVNNPKVLVPRHSNGNPVASPAGNAATQVAMYSFNYTASGNTTTGNNARVSLATAAQIGPCWGVAYNKYNDRIYTSALVKRHSGLGPGGPEGSPDPVNAPGSVYVINPNTSNSGSFFFSMDALGAAYYTHDHTSGAALNVRDNITRGLNKNINNPSADAAAFDQVGKTGIGDMEISDDGRYLWLTNLYNGKLYRIDLTSAISPVAPTPATAASLITSWSLPSISCSSTLRPWGLKNYRGKIYVGVVCTGENDVNTNSTSNVNTNYNGTTVTGGSFNLSNAYILEFNPSGAGTWATALTIPLSYPRGNAADENFNITRWYNWASNFDVLKAYPGNTSGALIHPQPILSNIEFDVDGTLMIGFMDRLGNQTGYGEYDLNGSSSYYGEVGGDLLRAYNNGCTFELENNGKEGASSPKAATSGANAGQGPGSGTFGPGGANYGEFYWDERYWYPSGPYWAHVETSLGNLAFLSGSNEVMGGVMDPFDVYSNGTANFNNTTGAANSRYEIITVAESGTFRKSSSLGDIELILPLAPIEVGNRVWYDVNDDGIQNASEYGLSGVNVELYNGAGTTLLATVTTDSQGNFYFNNTNVAGGLAPNTSYILRIASSEFNNIGIGPLGNLHISKKSITGNGSPGLSDSDASLAGGRAQISFTTGGFGQSNHDLDFGFTGNPLPLTLVSFTAQLNNNNQADLKWTTVSETNLSHFVIEKSTDGIHFSDATTVFATGDATDKTNYNVQDNIDPNQSPFIYYRLRSVDIDGKTYLSAIRILRISKQPDHNIKIIAYPNPVTNELRVTIPSDWQNKKVTYELFQANGQVAKKTESANSNQTETLNVNSLASGFYIVRVTCNSETALQKIVKQ